MSRYIYEDALKEVIQRMWENRKITNTKYNTFLEILDYVPTAEVVEVVRCKDCEDWQDDWIPSCGDNGSHYCATMDSVMKPTDFCSYAERREDAT